MTDPEAQEQVYPVFVINLDRRPDRLERMRAQLDAMNVAWERVPALDARAVSDADLEPEVDLRNMRHFVHRGAACLAKTNVRLMRRIVDEGLSGAVILQDDVDISPDLATVVRSRDCFPARFGLIQMEYWHKGSELKLMEPGEPTAIPGREVHRLHSRALGAACFFVRDHGARAFLEHGVPVRASGDHSLFNPAFAPAFDIMQTGFLNPALARQSREINGTDISRGVPGRPATATSILLRRAAIRTKLRKEIRNLSRIPAETKLRLTGRARRLPTSCDLGRTPSTDD